MHSKDDFCSTRGTRCLRRLIVPLLAAILLSACSPRQMVVSSLADELSAQGQASEEDLELARDAAPFYLKLSESVLRQNPGHTALALAVAAGTTQYSYAFVAFEADRLEARDAKAAQRLRERAARLYRRARDHAMTALELQRPGLAKALATAGPRPPLAADQVGLAYWAAASWGGMISLSKDDPEVVADLPLAMSLAAWAWQTEPDYGQGAMAGLMGTFEAARPGGAKQALIYFDRALALSAGKSAAAYVAKAEGHAQAAGNRALFEDLLKKALALHDAPGSPLAMQNEVMRRRAQWLLDSADDLF